MIKDGPWRVDWLRRYKRCSREHYTALCCDTTNSTIVI